MSYKLVGVKYRTNADVLLGREVQPVVVEVADPTHLSGHISDLLFNDKMNYVLTKWGSTLYVCEPVNIDRKVYEKTKIEYHPYQHLT